LKSNLILSALTSLLLLAGCDSKTSMSANDSGQKFIDACSSRLLSKKPSASVSQAEGFCSCVLAESSKKYTVSELNEKMESGASRAFKDTLASEVQLCNSRIRQ
jgi:outer membrane murein-binding lipoprotein Lpp